MMEAFVDPYGYRRVTTQDRQFSGGQFKVWPWEGMDTLSNTTVFVLQARQRGEKTKQVWLSTLSLNK